MPSLPGRKRMRLPDHDYGSPGFYFITILTADRWRAFGHVCDSGMRLSLLGHLARHHWMESARAIPEVRLDAFVVMPDHFHALIELTEGSLSTARANYSVSMFVQLFKAGVVRRARVGGLLPLDRRLWHRGYHDRIVRSRDAVDRVRRYIDDNPQRAALARRQRLGQGRSSAAV